MSFLRHGEIYRSDVGAARLGGTPGAASQRSSASMSLQSATPGGLLSSSARFRFTGRRHARTTGGATAMPKQPTVNCDLSGCLSPGVVHRRASGLRLIACFPGTRTASAWPLV